MGGGKKTKASDQSRRWWRWRRRQRRSRTAVSAGQRGKGTDAHVLSRGPVVGPQRSAVCLAPSRAQKHLNPTVVVRARRPNAFYNGRTRAVHDDSILRYGRADERGTQRKTVGKFVAKTRRSRLSERSGGVPTSKKRVSVSVAANTASRSLRKRVI